MFDQPKNDNDELYKRIVGPAKTRGYRPSTLIWPLWYWAGQAMFTLTDVESMRRDYQVNLGLKMLKAPLYTLEWKVTCKNVEVAKFVDKTLKDFWRPHISKVLRAFEYGYSACEIIYEYNEEDNKVYLKGMKEFHPRDVRVLTIDHEYVGFRVKNIRDEQEGSVDLMPPKGFWFSVNKEFGGWYGRSLFINIWDSWFEKRSKDGAIDIRRLWFYKNAFNGGVIRYPHKDYKNPDGTVTSARDMAREQGEKIKTGGVITFPSSKDEKGQYQWDWDRPQIQGNATEIREYPRDLDNEITRGLGIPDNVLTDSPGTGSYAGRRVPERAFYVSLEEIVAQLMLAFRVQVLDHLVRLNFEGKHDFTIETKPLVEIMSPEGTPPAGGVPGAGDSSMGAVFSNESTQTQGGMVPPETQGIG